MPALTTSQTIKTSRILIADDHQLIRRGIRTLLGGVARWEICGEAVNGQDTVSKVRKLKPDLVILDLNMRLMNGIEAARAIRRYSPSTKILVYSMHESPQIREALRDAGAHAYVLKSADEGELRKMIQHLLAPDVEETTESF